MIDLRSDTVTQPTESMRRAMTEAKLGDDVYEEDPTVLELEAKSARMMEKEAALLFPTGTMANQAAIMAHTNHGEEIIVEGNMHMFMYEVAGLSYLSGVQARLLGSERGFLDPNEIEANIRPLNIHFPLTSLICLENTHNVHGGTVLSQEEIDAVGLVAKAHRIPLHLDGARVFNAATYLDLNVSELVRSCDSVMFCLSKGLSAPIGSMLVGKKEFIQKARKCRKLLGGGMRQAGIIAACGLVALNEMVGRLDEDHNNARILAEGLSKLSWIDIDLSRVQTNIVRFNLDNDYISGSDFISYINNQGVKANLTGEDKVRMVTHKDLNEENIMTALKIIKNM